MLQSIILGLVEGATEFLPVSSTGHLLVAEHFLKVERSEAFNVLIQVGPILASAVVLHKKLLGWLLGMKNPAIRLDIFKVFVAFVITGVGGLVLEKAGLKLPDSVLPIAIATLIGVPVILLTERFASGRHQETTVGWPLVFAVAGAQLLAAAFPGTSRSGACVMAALLVGASRSSAVEFSFLVGIPTMLAAGGYKLLKEISQGRGAELASADTLVAFVVATVSAFLMVKWLLGYVRNHTFTPFAYYRLALGLGLLGALYAGILPNA